MVVLLTCLPHCPPLLPHVQASCAPSLTHAASSPIGAVHVEAVLAELAAAAAFLSSTHPATLACAWADRQQATASCTAATAAPGLSADAEDVAPRTHAASTSTAACTPYLPPARREGATAASRAGCTLAYPAPAQPASTQPPAAYVPPITAPQSSRPPPPRPAAPAAPAPSPTSPLPRCRSRLLRPPGRRRPGCSPASAADPLPLPLALLHQAVLSPCHSPRSVFPAV